VVSPTVHFRSTFFHVVIFGARSQEIPSANTSCHTPPSAKGSIAGKKARPNLGKELFITVAASAAPSLQSGIEPAQRDNRAPHTEVVPFSGTEWRLG
jgi:hypothetical protein